MISLLAARILDWAGDILERGVGKDLPLNPLEEICFALSQRIYALVWRLQN